MCVKDDFYGPHRCTCTAKVMCQACREWNVAHKIRTRHPSMKPRTESDKHMRRCSMHKRFVAQCKNCLAQNRTYWNEKRNEAL